MTDTEIRRTLLTALEVVGEHCTDETPQLTASWHGIKNVLAELTARENRRQADTVPNAD